MNSKRTWQWVVLAVAVLAYILVFERHLPETGKTPPPERLLPGWDPDLVEGIEVILRTNQVIRIERQARGWMMVLPIRYAAEPSAVDGFLKTIGRLTRQYHLSAQELPGPKEGLAAFGLEPPRSTLVLESRRQRIEIKVGAPTVTGDQVYYQVVGMAGLYRTGADFLQHLPAEVNDWRDRSVVWQKLTGFDRFEVRAGLPLGFEIQRDLAHPYWRLTKPTPARADSAKLDFLLRQLGEWEVRQFVSDKPRIELEAYGLTPPTLELAFGQGTNDLCVVQLGRSPTNDPSLVYVRNLTSSNIVLAPRSGLAPFTVPYTEFRDRRLISELSAEPDLIEVKADENFSVQRLTNGTWQVTAPAVFVADTGLVNEFLGQLTAIEVAEFDKDVVTDFAAYGLGPARRQYALKRTMPVPGKGLTNLLLVQLEFGSNVAGRVYARRSDESSVNWVRSADMARLPGKALALRDRTIWRFTTNQVSEVSIQYQGQTNRLIRGSNRGWMRVSNQPLAAPLASELDEVLFRLGQLQADAWVGQGEDKLGYYGIRDTAHHLAVVIEVSGRRQTLELDFGPPSPSQRPWAAVVLEPPQPLIFEFPLMLFQLYRDLVRVLRSAPPP